MFFLQRLESLCHFFNSRYYVHGYHLFHFTYIHQKEIMKNLILVSAAFLFIGLSACKKTDVSPTPEEKELIDDGIYGGWTVDSILQKNGLIRVDGQEYATYHTQSSNMDGSYKLYKDNTFTSTIGYNQTTYMNLFGVEFEQNNRVPETTTEGTFDYDENGMSIAFTSNGETSAADIIELTTTSCVWKTSIERTETDGQSVSTTTADVYVYTSR